MDVATHYDYLIDIDNDPFRDPLELRQHMDKWDGQAFIDTMKLSENESVLEIGVGTGRLAARVLPRCNNFCGIDISPKTIRRAGENLGHDRITLICGDFLAHNFEQRFDVAYSSLTLMHFADKQAFLAKVSDVLKNAGRFVLSIDKNQSNHIDMGAYQLTIFPDDPAHIVQCAESSGLTVDQQFETEFAYVFAMRKN